MQVEHSGLLLGEFVLDLHNFPSLDLDLFLECGECRVANFDEVFPCGDAKARQGRADALHPAVDIDLPPRPHKDADAAGRRPILLGGFGVRLATVSG